MDRISALRNVETALTEFEEGETDLEGLERQVRAVLRTYATEFEDDRTTVYVVDAGAMEPGSGEADGADARGDNSDGADARSDDSDGTSGTALDASPSDGGALEEETDSEPDPPSSGAIGEVVVVAGSPSEARERAAEIADADWDRATVELLSERA